MADDARNSEITVRRERFVEATGGFASALVLLSFVNQPLMRLAHPVALSIGGLMLALGVVLIYINYIYKDIKSPWFFAGFLSIISSIMPIGVCWVQAIQISRHVDDVCADLERKMLSDKNDDHSPAVFQALSCRPELGSAIKIK